MASERSYEHVGAPTRHFLFSFVANRVLVPPMRGCRGDQRLAAGLGEERLGVAGTCRLGGGGRARHTLRGRRSWDSPSTVRGPGCRRLRDGAASTRHVCGERRAMRPVCLGKARRQRGRPLRRPCHRRLGAGHTPARVVHGRGGDPFAKKRMDRLIEVTGAVTPSSAGPVSESGSSVTLCEAPLGVQPIQQLVPLLIEGR